MGNQMEKNMGDEMEAGAIQGFIAIIGIQGPT